MLSLNISRHARNFEFQSSSRWFLKGHSVFFYFGTKCFNSEGIPELYAVFPHGLHKDHLPSTSNFSCFCDIKQNSVSNT
jgi:hypothetical protein